MENQEEKKLKLIYVHKIGYDAKENGLFEFIFSYDPTKIDYKSWGWDLEPASDNACVPTDNYYDSIFTVKIQDFDLFCLHEAVDREYMHGYHNIHALAYETEKENLSGIQSYDNLFESETIEDQPLLVFHYGMQLDDVKKLFYSRNVLFEEK